MLIGKIFLLPTFLGETSVDRIMPLYNAEVFNNIKYYIVENERTARRALAKMGHRQKISELIFFEIDKHNKTIEWDKFFNILKNGDNIAIMSEAGCPGIADPGDEIVKLAHKNDIKVVPLVGASSILLALMASGANGQNFKFNGYIPIKTYERKQKIKSMETAAIRFNETQIFIETPYRNMQLFTDIVDTCNSETLLTIACDLTIDNEFITTKNIKTWKMTQPDINKRQAVFVLFT